MKLQIDTSRKTIKIEEDAKLIKLFSLLKKLFPNGEWKEFILETNTIIEHWQNPIIIGTRDKWTEWPWYKQYEPIVTYTVSGGTNTTTNMTGGIFNVQCVENKIIECK